MARAGQNPSDPDFTTDRDVSSAHGKPQEFFVHSQWRQLWQGIKAFEVKQICHPQGLMKRKWMHVMIH